MNQNRRNYRRAKAADIPCFECGYQRIEFVGSVSEPGKPFKKAHAERWCKRDNGKIGQFTTCDAAAMWTDFCAR